MIFSVHFEIRELRKNGKRACQNISLWKSMESPEDSWEWTDYGMIGKTTSKRFLFQKHLPLKNWLKIMTLVLQEKQPLHTPLGRNQKDKRTSSSFRSLQESFFLLLGCGNQTFGMQYKDYV